MLVGFAAPTSITVVPDGRLIVTERAGRVRVVLPGRTGYEPVPFLQLTNIEATVGERALINLALDPAFAANGHYYVFYTSGSPLRDTVSRFTAVGNTTDLATEVVLYQDLADSSDIHHGGGLAIGPDGALYISTGDGHDTQPGAAHASQRLTSYRGKVLRLNRDGSVPLDNPFHDGPGPNLDAIWALGLRNPFRLSFDAVTGTLHAYDVGGGAWEEVNRLVAGANFGWPICEGVCAVDGMTNPSFAYPHAGRDAAIGGGVVYRGTAFPASHHGNLFYGDFVQSWIRRLVFAGDGSLAGDLPFDPPDGSSDGPTGPVVDLDVGLDGAIYYVNIGGGAVHRISYYSGNRPPTISAAAALPSGGASAPLAVQFSVEAADLDAQPLSYTWEFGDGTTSSERAPLHLYQTNGTFSARVLVSDGTATTYSDPIEIVVGSAPIVTILAPDAGALFQAGADITLSGSATDDGPLPDSAYSWTVVFRHDTHVHPAFGPFSGPSGAFTVPTSGHDFSGDTSYEATLTVTDAQGLSASATRVLAPVKQDLTLATAPTGLSIALDAITRPAPLVHDTLVGFSHRVTAPTPQQVGGVVYEFTGWSDGGAAAHDIVAPAAATTLVATYRPVPTLSVADVAVVEGDAGTTVLTFTVSLSAPSTSPVTVAYASADDTASSGSDYQPVTGTLTFNSGEVSATVAVTVAGDTDPEADERLSLALATPSGALIGDGSAVGTIVNDDVVPIVVSIGAASFAEGTGSTTSASWPVTLSAASPTAVSVQYAVTAGTATAGTDFAAASGTLTFAAGATQATIAVAVAADALDEPDETIAATLDSAVNASIGVGAAVGTIVDDDAAPAISVADVVVVEGPPGIASAVVTLTLSAASGRVVSATAATSDQTAGSADYTATTATVTLAARHADADRRRAGARRCRRRARRDGPGHRVESRPTRRSPTASAVVTIADDDPAPTLVISDVTVTEGNAGSAPSTFTVTLTGATSRTVTVAFATAASHRKRPGRLRRDLGLADLRTGRRHSDHRRAHRRRCRVGARGDLRGRSERADQRGHRRRPG